MCHFRPCFLIILWNLGKEQNICSQLSTHTYTLRGTSLMRSVSVSLLFKITPKLDAEFKTSIDVARIHLALAQQLNDTSYRYRASIGTTHD